jgi:hypothetical protein
MVDPTPSQNLPSLHPSSLLLSYTVKCGLFLLPQPVHVSSRTTLLYPITGNKGERGCCRVSLSLSLETFSLLKVRRGMI